MTTSSSTTTTSRVPRETYADEDVSRVPACTTTAVVLVMGTLLVGTTNNTNMNTKWCIESLQRMDIG